MSPALLSALPTELLDDICTLLDRQDLLALAQTCRLHNAIARRSIFRTVAVHPCARKTWHCVRFIATHPDVASHVRSFSIRTAPTHVLPSFARTLQTALTNMRHLVALAVFIDPQYTWVLPSNPSGFLRLQQFSCDFPLDSSVAAFLRATPFLKDVQLGGGSGGGACISGFDAHRLLDGAAMDMSRFVGPCEAARALVPDRPVQSVHLYGGSLTPDVISALSRSSENISVFEAVVDTFEVSLLLPLAQSIPKVNHVRIATDWRLAEAPPLTFYDSVARTLNNMTDLSSFELSGLQWAYAPNTKYNERVWHCARFAIHTDPINQDVRSLNEVDVY